MKFIRDGRFLMQPFLLAKQSIKQTFQLLPTTIMTTIGACMVPDQPNKGDQEQKQTTYQCIIHKKSLYRPQRWGLEVVSPIRKNAYLSEAVGLVEYMDNENRVLCYWIFRNKASKLTSVAVS